MCYVPCTVSLQAWYDKTGLDTVVHPIRQYMIFLEDLVAKKSKDAFGTIRVNPGGGPIGPGHTIAGAFGTIRVNPGGGPIGPGHTIAGVPLIVTHGTTCLLADILHQLDSNVSVVA